MITVADLLVPYTADAVRATLVSNLVAAKIPADKWKPGGVFSTILTYVAAFIAGASTLWSQAFGAGWVETASGGWLRVVAYYVYGVTPQDATFATGQLTLTNSSGNIYNYSAGQAIFQDSTTKQTYVNAASFTLGANGTVTIDIEAQVAGTASNAAPGEIDTLVTSMLGVTCSNAAAVVGLDAQSDDSIKTDCMNRRAASSVRGPRTAYAYYATRTPGLNGQPDTTLLNSLGLPVNINRILVSTASHTGDVTVYLASPAGAAIAVDVTAAAGSFEANVRPDGVTVTTLSANEVVYAPTLTIWAQALPGLAATDVANAASAALAAFLSTYPISGLSAANNDKGLFASGIDGVVKSAHPAIFAIDGATDLLMNAGDVAANGITLTGANVRLVTS